MARVITRYRGGSRKLYDKTESRYISLSEIPRLIREGEELRVLDNHSGADVTAQVLAQVISESEKRGVSFLSARAMHDIIRRSERLVSGGVHYLRHEVERLVSTLEPTLRARSTRTEVELLRNGVRRLEQSLGVLDARAASRPARRRTRRVRSAPAGRIPNRTHVEES